MSQIRPFHLVDEFIETASEQALIAAIAREPSLYWELQDLLPDGAFVTERKTWRQLAKAIQTEDSTLPEISVEWKPSPNPRAAAEHLADLHQRRLLAEVQEQLGQALYDRDGHRPAHELAAFLEEEAARIQATIRETKAARLTWASEMLPHVLRDVEQRWAARQATGKPVMGIPTGLTSLDTILGGLEAGLYILGGAPGTGKTTLALQMACDATREAPVIYLTFENSPANLTLKGLVARANQIPELGKEVLQPRDVMRGWVDPRKLRLAAGQWKPIAEKLAVVEGSGQLTVSQLRAKALEAMNRHGADRCLIVVDYLQLWAKASAEMRGLTTVRERVETLGTTLRELAMRLSSPVLALSSQNRSQGDYGSGKGKAALDSLKESGDLEYASDVVLFLTPAEDRTTVKPAVAVDLTVAKNRHGETGKVEMIFRPDIATMREQAR